VFRIKICSQKEGRKEGRKHESVKVRECQGVRLVIILYESGSHWYSTPRDFVVSLFGRHVFIHESLSQKRGGILQSYTYSLRVGVGGKLYLLVTQVCIRSLPFHAE
jgi:hypothetical protein